MSITQLQSIELGEGVKLNFKSETSYRWGKHSGIQSNTTFKPLDYETNVVVLMLFETTVLTQNQIENLYQKVGSKLYIREFVPSIMGEEKIAA